jgi:hypothetical protein
MDSSSLNDSISSEEKNGPGECAEKWCEERSSMLDLSDLTGPG